MENNNEQVIVDTEQQVETGEPQVETSEEGWKEKYEKIASEYLPLAEQFLALYNMHTALVAQHDALTAKAAEPDEAFLRLQAEFDNYRKRTAREKVELVSTASEKLTKGLLPVLDTFGMAIQASSEERERKGLELLLKQLTGVLSAHGLKEMEVLGETFSDEIAEAIALLPSEGNAGKIIEVSAKGYRLGDKIIRYPKVIVGM